MSIKWLKQKQGEAPAQSKEFHSLYNYVAGGVGGGELEGDSSVSALHCTALQEQVCCWLVDDWFLHSQEEVEEEKDCPSQET